MKQLMKAAKDGDVATLVVLIQDRKISIHTCGPEGRPWVS